MAIRINRVYTRGGDKGETSLVGGGGVPKGSARIGWFGTVDGLNAILGVARAAARERPAKEAVAAARLETLLSRLQNELFDVGADLATRPADRHPGQR